MTAIDFNIEPNEFLAVTGVSGSGKSTLLKLLGCMDTATSGEYKIDGIDPSELTNDSRALLRRDTFGFVFQDFRLISDLSAEQNVSLAGCYSGLSIRDSRSKAKAILKSLSVGDRSTHLPSALSGGQQQRVAIARALMNGGQIILADEPTASLDSEMASEIMSTLFQLHAAGRTVIVSTHDPAIVAYAHRVITLKEGKVASDLRQEPCELPLRHSPEPALCEEKLSNKQTNSIAKLNSAVEFSLYQFRKNFLRTALTVLGIIIGCAAFIVMISMGNGQKDVILRRIAEMGTDVLFIVPISSPSRSASPNGSFLRVDDVEAIQEINNISNIAPEITGVAVFRYSNSDHAIRIDATTPSYFAIKRWPASVGTIFTDDDVAQLQPVAVLGQAAARSIFGSESAAIGKYVVANNVLLQVIGVLESKGSGDGGQDADSIVFVPLSTGQARLLGRKEFNVINVQVNPSEALDTVQGSIEEKLTKRHQRKDFNVHNMAAIIRMTEATKDSLTWLLASVASLSLLVGGIGVMNVMMMSVLERFREIGIRIACGASRRDIVQLFGVEAFALSSIGGLAGCFLGTTLLVILSASNVPVKFSGTACALALAFSVSIGMLFGYLPARRAARRDPVEFLN